MTLFWKAAGAVLITVVLCLALDKQQKDISILLTMAVCCMVCAAAFFYLEPVLEYLRELETIGDFQTDILDVLLKVLGIGLVSEVACMVCNDAGNSSLGKTVQMLGNATVLYLSLPVLRSFVDLIRQILGEI